MKVSDEDDAQTPVRMKTVTVMRMVATRNGYLPICVERHEQRREPAMPKANDRREDALYGGKKGV